MPQSTRRAGQIMKPFSNSLRNTLSVALLVLSLAACAPNEVISGHVPTPGELDDIRPGVTDRDSIAELLGNPSTIATFESDTWYYITRKSTQIAFFQPKITEQTVVAVHFDEAGIVKEVRHYALENGRIIDPVSRTTPTRGRELTVLEQLFRNLGRFSAN